MKRLHLGILIITLLILAGGLLGYSLVRNGFFPVALVNGKVILFSHVEDNMIVSKKIFSTAGFFEDEELEKLFSGNDAELFQKTLESLIVNTVVKTSIPDEVRQLADKRIKDYLASVDYPQLSSSIKLLYGWDFDTFRERILEPQAFDEALLEKKGDELEEWLAEARTAAKVSIWFLPFEWEKGRLVGK